MNELLKQSMRETKLRVTALQGCYPFVWHMNCDIATFSTWISNLVTGLSDPNIYDLTIVCLAVRAATDTAEFEWRTNPATRSKTETEVDVSLRPTFCDASKFVREKAALLAGDREIAEIYADHIDSNLQILTEIVSRTRTLDERSRRICELRHEIAEGDARLPLPNDPNHDPAVDFFFAVGSMHSRIKKDMGRGLPLSAYSLAQTGQRMLEQIASHENVGDQLLGLMQRFEVDVVNRLIELAEAKNSKGQTGRFFISIVSGRNPPAPYIMETGALLERDPRLLSNLERLKLDTLPLLSMTA